MIAVGVIAITFFTLFCLWLNWNMLDLIKKIDQNFELSQLKLPFWKCFLFSVIIWLNPYAFIFPAIIQSKASIISPLLRKKWYISALISADLALNGKILSSFSMTVIHSNSFSHFCRLKLISLRYFNLYNPKNISYNDIADIPKVSWCGIFFSNQGDSFFYEWSGWLYLYQE